MTEVQELVASRLGSKTKVVFPSSLGYTGMPPALQFVYAMLILIAEGNGWRMLMAASNREEQLTTWRKYPVRSVVISSQRKKTDGAYQRHNREDWTAGQRERRDAFDDAAWAE